MPYTSSQEVTFFANPMEGFNIFASKKKCHLVIVNHEDLKNTEVDP